MIERNLLEEYRNQSEEISNLSEEIRNLKRKFEDSIQDKTNELKEKSEKLSSLKEKITQEALEEFTENGKTSKKLTGGIAIREKKVISYDENTALEFAKEKDLFLMLDKKSFEKAAETLNLDWIEVKKEEQVTFPKEIKLED